MTVITHIGDLNTLYRRKVPKVFYEYVECGSWTEQTLRENLSDFARIRLRQRVGIDVSSRHLTAQMAGQDVAMPIALAPVGMAGIQCADGEIKSARAAERFGVPFTLPTMSINSIEEVAAHTTKPFWFQLYVMRDEGFSMRLIERAKDAKCSALMVTLDLPVIGQQHRNLKNNMALPSKWSASTVFNVLTKWSWGKGMVPQRRRQFGNISGHVKEISDNTSLRAWLATQFDGTLNWDTVKRIRRAWDGKLILKGILDPADAKLAHQAGADAVVVSNHGGRQLDGALSAIQALPAVLDSVGDRVEVHLDSGVRSGQDVLKALALGAKATYVGRAYIYGLGALGETGVTTALEILRKELDCSMALCGVRRVQDLGRDNLLLPKDFFDYQP